MSIAIISLCSFLCGVYAQVAPDLNIGTMPAMFAHGDHFSVGQQVGYFTRNSIKFRLNNSEAIQNVIEWVESTREGFSAYQAMLMTAKETFPEYIDELRGMAYGSGISFQTLFILNVRSELGVFMLNESNFEKVEHCSDYLLHTDTGIVIGHNEDGGWEDRDNSVLLTIHIEGQRVKEQIKFTAFTYPGDLATDAYFWNEHGVVGSQNGLYPNHCLYGGLGRNFVSRHLVAATSLEDAIARATMGNQATGHSFNLASKYEERLVNIEVKPNVESSGSSGQVRSLSQSPYVITSVEKGSSLFHANCYIYMDADADCSTSSQHRMARASELPPAKSVQDVLVTLGDTEDKDYPIYRSGVGDDKDNGYTISTVIFHLGFENKTHASTSASDASVTIYLNNPKTHENIHFKYSTIEIV